MLKFTCEFHTYKFMREVGSSICCFGTKPSFFRYQCNLKVQTYILEIWHICVTWYILGRNEIFSIKKASSLGSFWSFKLPELASLKSMQMSYCLKNDLNDVNFGNLNSQTNLVSRTMPVRRLRLALALGK